MPSSEEPSEQAGSRQVSDLFDSSELAHAIDTEDFKHFLDYIPLAVMISKEIRGRQRIIYVNKAFEVLVGKALGDVRGRDWSILNGLKHEDDQELTLDKALQTDPDFVGTFHLDVPSPLIVEGHASLIQNDDGTDNYRILALIDVTQRARAQRDEFSRRLRDKDTLLLELQHRVKNNLQLVTALIRLEARFERQGETVNLDRLAGRIEALQLLYRDLSPETWGQAVDLGHYLSQIASAAMHTYAVDGIRLDLKVDNASVSINVAMPLGLIVNELMMNSFKYAFNGRDTGAITIRCLHENENEYQVAVADNGVGLPEGTTWPMPGKLSALIVQTLRENTKATAVTVETAPNEGTRVAIRFECKTLPPKLQ